MTEPTPTTGLLQWQTKPEDGIAEPPILIGAYMDCIGISQNGDGVTLQYTDVDEFCKNLKALSKKHKEEAK